MKWSLLIILMATQAWAMPDTAKLVPDSTVVSKTKIDVKVKTKAGTTIELGFDDDGELEEASGTAAIKGDAFIPGDGLLTLKAITDELAKNGKTLQGEWTFEENEEGDWVYDLEGSEKGKEVDFIVNAKTGKLIATEIDE